MITKQYTGQSFTIKSPRKQEIKKDINNLKQKLESENYLSVLREMGIPSEVIKLMADADGSDMTEKDYERVTKQEDGC